MTDLSVLRGHSAIRSWLGVLLLAVVYFLFSSAEGAIYGPIARAFNLHMIEQGAMGLRPYAVLMVVRLSLELLVVAGVFAVLGRPVNAFPLVGPRMFSSTLVGLATGLVVMVGAIVAIIGTGHASATRTAQPLSSALLNGSGWLAFDFVGAMGEELFGRVAVLMVAERLVGWRGAVVASGVMFSAIHLDNPGASPIWLVRLLLQGMLLAFAVFRTRSFWWSTGYHTGWNWASAPLFGAAGSGYLDQGHLLDFTPTGSDWITGGLIGPEGSIWAFIAVLCAFCTLLLTATSPSEAMHDARAKQKDASDSEQLQAQALELESSAARSL